MILGLAVRIVFGSLHRNLFQHENVHRLRIGATAQVLRARAERKRSDRHAPLHAASELKQLRSILHIEHPDDRSLLAGSRNLRAGWIECDRSQCRIMCRNHGFRMQIDGIKYLHLAGSSTARIGQKAVIRVSGQCAQAGHVGRRVPDGVHHFHVPNVVNVQRLLETNHQTGTVQFDGQNGVRIRVVAYFGAFLEVAYLK